MENNYLPEEWGYTEAEIEAIDVDLLTHKVGFAKDERLLCTYEIHNESGYTGKIVIVAVDSVIDTQDALNRQWNSQGLKVLIGTMGGPTTQWMQLLNAVYTIADKWRYQPKFAGLCTDRVYTNNRVLEGMIQ